VRSREGTGEITLRRLVKGALRMRPSRIIVGKARQEVSLDLLNWACVSISGTRATSADR